MEHFMARASAFIGFFEGAVIEPNYCIPTIFSVFGDRDRSTQGITDHKGTGGIKADTDDIGRIGFGFGHGGADGEADGGPDILAVVLGEIGVGAPHEDRIFVTAQ
jgi:hypothetical protein